MLRFSSPFFASSLTRSFETVDPGRHATHSWYGSSNYLHAVKLPVVPIVVDEAFPVAGSLPILFTSPKDDDLPVAVVAPEGDAVPQAVLADGSWIAGYVPLWLRLHPFACHLDDRDDAVLFDPQSSCIDPSPRGIRFFDVTGAATPDFERVVDIVRRYRLGLKRTRHAVAALRKAGLLQPATQRPAFDEPAFEGLTVVDARALAKLQAVRVPPLFSSGALMLAHAHLASLEQAPRLARLAEWAAQRDRPGVGSAQRGGGSDFLDMLAGAVSADEMVGLKGSE